MCAKIQEYSEMFDFAEYLACIIRSMCGLLAGKYGENILPHVKPAPVKEEVPLRRSMPYKVQVCYFFVCTVIFLFSYGFIALQMDNWFQN